MSDNDNRTVKFTLLVLTAIILLTFCESLHAQTPRIQKRVVKPQVHSKAVDPAVKDMIAVSLDSVEIVTTEDNTHFWQVTVKNNSNKSGSITVYVQALGFRPEDTSEIMKGVIERIEAGKTASARGPLPSFAGMHQLKVKAGGGWQTVQIPRPFRQDSDGHPEKGLKFNRAYFHRVNGKVRWYLETKPNVYADIPAGAVGVGVDIRGRKKKYCHEDSHVRYFNSNATNEKVIKTGKTYTFSGEIIANPHPDYPKVYDYIVLKFQGDDHWVELPQSMYNNWTRCGKRMEYLK